MTDDEFTRIGEPGPNWTLDGALWSSEQVKTATGYLPHSKLYTDRVYEVRRGDRRWVDRTPVFEIGPAFDNGKEFYWVVTIEAAFDGRHLDPIPKVLRSIDTWVDLTPPADDILHDVLDLLGRLRDKIEEWGNR